MAWGNFGLDKGGDVSGPISKFHAVKFTGDQEYGPITAATDRIAGFAQFDVTTDEMNRGKGASVRYDGISEATVGDATAIDVGDLVQLMDDGRVQKAVGGSGARLVGTCVGSPSTAENDRIALDVDTDGILVGASLP